MSDYVNREEMLKRFDRRAKSTVGDKRVGVDSIRVFIENIPAADVVSREAYEQVRWERDVAIEQLSQIGKSFGEKMDDIVPVVRCQNCKYCADYGTPLWCEKLKMEIKPGFYCGFGEKYEWCGGMTDTMILGTKTDEERDFYSGIQKKERE